MSQPIHSFEGGSIPLPRPYPNLHPQNPREGKWKETAFVFALSMSVFLVSNYLFPRKLKVFPGIDKLSSGECHKIKVEIDKEFSKSADCVQIFSKQFSAHTRFDPDYFAPLNLKEEEIKKFLFERPEKGNYLCKQENHGLKWEEHLNGQMTAKKIDSLGITLEKGHFKDSRLEGECSSAHYAFDYHSEIPGRQIFLKGNCSEGVFYEGKRVEGQTRWDGHRFRYFCTEQKVLQNDKNLNDQKDSK